MDGQLSYTPHPNPPRTEEDQLDRLRLIRSRKVGPVTFHRLIAEYGSARTALEALPQIAREAGVENYTICTRAAGLAELQAGARAGAQPLFYGDSHYPAALAALSDAPPFLWILGNRALLERPAVAMVGARNASSLGMRMARQLAADLAAAGQVIVSGLARGIDAQAHEGALGGGTIAVMAGGVDCPYPEENRVLAGQIAEAGLLVSEQPMGLMPSTKHFPIRNRLISGLSQAVIVIEAASRSGSLITASAALDQGREVMAVPGHPFDPRASGCNHLLREGAHLVRNAQDVLTLLTEPSQSQPPKIPKVVGLKGETEELDAEILSRLSLAPMAEDLLIRDLKIIPQRLAPMLLNLEMTGHIIRHAGGLLSRSG